LHSFDDVGRRYLLVKHEGEVALDRLEFRKLELRFGLGRLDLGDGSVSSMTSKAATGPVKS